MTYRTLQELAVIVSGRLGFGAQGASLGANAFLIRSFVQSAQYQLYWMQNWKKLTKWEDVSIGLDQYLTDYPTDLNPERILKIAVNRSSDPANPDWQDLKQGIETQHYNTQAIENYPLRYELYAQIETWPKCDTVRKMRVWGILAIPRFTENADRAVIDDEMILLHATSAGKSHYRQPDANVWASQLDALMARIRGTAFGNKRFHAPGKEDVDVTPRPVVV